MDTNTRISNLSRSELTTLWKDWPSDQIDELIKKSNPKEISQLFGHIPEQGVTKVLDSISQESVNRIFNSLSPGSINKVLLLSNNSLIASLPKVLDNKTFLRTIKVVSSDLRNRILKSLPIEKRNLLFELSEDEKELDENFKFYLSEKFENSLEREALARIQEIEEKERLMERRLRAREEQYAIQIEQLKEQIAETERELHSRQNKFKNIENNYLKRESELRDKIRLLQEEHQKQVQEKIEIKVPEFVKSALEVLEKKESDFSRKSDKWNRQANIALGCAIATALGALFYGAFEFNSAAKNNIDWLFFGFLILKGLIVVALFGAWAKHAYNLGNAYMHESLKRSDRMHAINFGKLYLEVYGNNVNQSDMKSIFENWNISSDSAFTKIEQTNFDPKVMDNVVKMIKAVSDATSNNKKI
ncbi:hypothetical protein ACH518_03690 [Methylomonas sp. HW2-6]|uniref:hypothetical protein n=1 Tax=Methylomonas sp. HW2-6 TaxID=3376687 RepID=UPI004040ED70